MGTSDPLVVFKITILQVNCVTIHEAYHQNSLSVSLLGSEKTGRWKLVLEFRA